MTTILFFDDEPLMRRDNVFRRLGRARRIEESVFHDPYGNCTWGYPAVFRAPSGKGWNLIYGVNFDPKLYRGGQSVGLATSEDGLHWRPDERAAQVDIPNRMAPHQITGAYNGLFCSGFELDRVVDGLERYNLLYHPTPDYHPSQPPAPDAAGGTLWTSADCVRWRVVPGAAWQYPNPDPPTFVNWNAHRNSFVLTTRPDFADRRIALYETQDFRSYTPLDLALYTDSLDRPLTQIYGMPVFPYEGRYVAFPWMFDLSPTEKGRLPHKYEGGKQYGQFAYSFDGWHWQRGIRDPLVPNGEPGDPDGGCLQPSSMVQLDDGSLRIYASTSRHEHGHCPPDDGYIVAYSLRRDGFAYLESDGGVGIVGTRPLHLLGGGFELNAQAPAGWVRAQLAEPDGKPIEGYTFADSDVLHGDQTAWRPRWGGRDASELADRFVTLEIHLENARLYAIRGNFVECRYPDVIRFQRDGTRPQPGRLPGRFASLKNA